MVTALAAQLIHMGTLQPSITKLQPNAILVIWANATIVNMMAVMMRYTSRFMARTFL